MSIKSTIQSIRLGLKAGVKVSDALLVATDELEGAMKIALDAINEIKEITPEDEDEPKDKE